MSDPLSGAVNAIRNGHCIIASTGAGISVESGIPDFRGPHGIWLKYPPDQYATIDAFMADPARIWKFWLELASSVGGVEPNDGHRALAELEAHNKLDAVITQNVDNLHQAAGSRNVVEYHGNARRLTCLECGTSAPFAVRQDDPLPPRCACGGVWKPDVVMFGEAIPAKALADSENWVSRCDVVLVVGTSANVFPAAEIPYAAKKRGAYVIEVNIEATDFTASVTDAFLKGPATEVLPRLAQGALAAR